MPVKDRASRHQITLFRTALLFLFLTSATWAQVGERDLRLFGYFQNNVFNTRTTFKDGRSFQQNSFAVQQLNVFLQRDLAPRWTALVNFELINSYSSNRNWGTFSLEEAWVKYRFGHKLSLKLGQHIPPFNNFNEIKNRTPLMAYIVRPLVYETSFSELIPLEDFAPGRAFLQAYGYLPWKKTKVDYGIYLGNSPHINRDSNFGQTGVDRSDRYLVGGRVGLRYRDYKAGISGTYEEIDDLKAFFATEYQHFFNTGELDGLFAALDESFTNVPRWRWGADFSFELGKFDFESEIIRGGYDDNATSMQVDRSFSYATLGYHHSEALYVYLTYQTEEDELTRFNETFESFPTGLFLVENDIDVPGIGFSYRINDRILTKAQYSPVNIKTDIPPTDYTEEDQDINYLTAGISVIF